MKADSPIFFALEYEILSWLAVHAPILTVKRRLEFRSALLEAGQHEIKKEVGGGVAGLLMSARIQLSSLPLLLPLPPPPPSPPPPLPLHPQSQTRRSSPFFLSSSPSYFLSPPQPSLLLLPSLHSPL